MRLAAGFSFSHKSGSEAHTRQFSESSNSGPLAMFFS